MECKLSDLVSFTYFPSSSSSASSRLRCVFIPSVAHGLRPRIHVWKGACVLMPDWLTGSLACWGIHATCMHELDLIGTCMYVHFSISMIEHETTASTIHLESIHFMR